MAKTLPPCPSTRRAKWVTDAWTLEALSCSMSIMATVAVGIVLLVYDSKPFPKLPSDIGLNTIVSILGTISKSGLLFCVAASIGQYRWLNLSNISRVESLLKLQLYDEASRGPWGSIFLLSSGEKASWARLGALVTVSCLAFDPVYQLLIKFEQREIYRNSASASVKRAEAFDDPTNQLNLVDYGNPGLSNDWTLAITNAILNDDYDLEANLACPTGNCTFPLFSSLGFCSNCVDVTTSMQQQASCKSENFTIENSDFTASMNCTYDFPSPGSGLKYSATGVDTDTNGSLFLSWMYDPASNSMQQAPAFLTIFLLPYANNSSPLDHYNDYTTFQTPFRSEKAVLIPSSLTHIALIKMAPDKGSMSAGFIEAANICALSFCAREYNASVDLGVSNTSLLSTFYSALSLHSDPGRLGGQFSSYTFPNVTNNFTFTPGFTQTDTSTMLEAGLQMALSIILKGNLTLDYDTHDFSPPAPLISVPTDILQVGLNASSDIPRTMDRIALAMTTQLRDISNLTVYGNAASIETYIRVEWPWFTIPALTVSLGSIFLIAAMIETRRRKLYIWKNSELALLFHRLELASNNAAEVLKASEMEEIAAAMKVELEQGRRGEFFLQKRK